MQGKVTKRAVDALGPGKIDAFLWDTEVKGFGLKVTPGGRKVYLLQYRMGGRGAPTRRVTIGTHGSPWTPEEARTEAVRLLGLMVTGTDPGELKAKERTGLTVADLCRLYLAEGCATKKASTLAIDRGRIARHIVPLLGRKRVVDVDRGDVERLMQDVAAGRTACTVKTGFRGRAVVSGGKGTASKCVALLGAIFTFAVGRKLRPDNPVHGVKRYKDGKVQRFLSQTEMARLGEALSKAERAGVNPVPVAAIRLLVLTGCRKSEILGLQWEHVDFERRCLRLPESKTGAKVVPLGAPALDLLATLPRAQDNSYVLPGEKVGAAFVGVAKVWNAVRAAAGLPDLRLHDLRHSFASVAAAGGDSLLMIGKLLGHSQAATTQRYAHLADDPVHVAADRVAREIDAAMRGDGKGMTVRDEQGDQGNSAKR